MFGPWGGKFGGGAMSRGTGPLSGNAQRVPRIVAAFDVLSASNYTTGTGGIATLINQAANTGIVPTQANTSLRPDYAATGINSGPAIQFVAATNDSFTVTGARSAFMGTDGIWCYCVGEFAALPAVSYNIAAIFSSSGSGGLAAFTLLSSGKLRMSCRRVASDSVRNVDSTLLVPTGTPVAFGQGSDTRRGRVLVAIDQDTQYISTGAFTSGYGAMEWAAATADHLIGRNGSVQLQGFIGRIYLGTGVATPEFFESLRLINQPIFNTPQRTLTVTTLASNLQNKIYRSTAGVVSYTASGAVVVGADASITARLLDVVTRTPATGWETPVAITTSSGLAWSATFNVPDGSWYLEVRKSGERDVDAVVDTTNIIGVSDNITAFLGQSLMRNQVTEIGGGTAYPPVEFEGSLPASGDSLRDRRFSYADYGYFYLAQTTISSQFVPVGTGEPSDYQMASGTGGPGGGNGSLALGPLLRDLHSGAPSLIVNEAVGGTGIATHLAPSGDSWLRIRAELDEATSPGYDWTRAVMNIGQTDINQSASYATFHDGLIDYIEQIRGLATDGNALYFYLCPVSWVSAGSPTTVEAHPVYQATWDILDTYDNNNTDGNGRVFIGYTDHDMPRRDGYHLEPANNPHTMRRLAQNIAYREGLGGVTHGARGPELTSIAGTNGGTTIVGTFTLDGGTTLQGLVYDSGDPYFAAPAYQNTGLTGTLARVNGTPVTPTSVAITSATQVTWTLPSSLSTGNTIEIGLYTDPSFDQSVMLTDDSNPQGDTIGVPAQPTRLWVSSTVA
jgi:hypothetical protein